MAASHLGDVLGVPTYLSLGLGMPFEKLQPFFPPRGQTHKPQSEEFTKISGLFSPTAFDLCNVLL